MKVIVILLLTIQSVVASEFNLLWDKIEKNSHALKSTEYEVELKKLEKERASRHWLPRVMLGARQFQTNDPSAVLFNRLGQGEVEQTDFIPNDLNDPDTQSFLNTSLMLDMPLYEGGLKENQKRAFEKNYQAAKYKKQATQVDLYSQFIDDYFTYKANKVNSSLLNSLEEQIKSLIKKYKLGSKSSPVGYSGLLGYQTVLKKISSAQNAFEAESSIILKVLSLQAQDHNLSLNKSENLIELLNKVNKKTEGKEQQSSSLKSFSLQVSAMDHYKEMENARHLPKIGAFASSNSYAGDRGENNVQSVGLYLQWDLFNNDSYGRSSEAIKRAKMMQMKLKSYARKEQSYRESIGEAVDRLIENHKYIEESLNLIDTQIKVSLGLYKKGRINGIQMAQIYNNKVDLILAKKQLEDKLIDMSVQQYKVFH